MGPYIIAIGLICKRWWFAILMSIILWYMVYVFATGIDAHMKNMELYYRSLGM